MEVLQAVEVGSAKSPIGVVRMAVLGGKVCAVGFGDGFDEALVRRFGAVPRKRRGAEELSWRLDAYFDGELGALAELEVDPGGTEFQQKVWNALRRIPPGETRTYRQVAEAVGRPTAVRAVGACNAASAIALVIPCHRVVGASGDLRGYAYGERRKAWLLAHERACTAAAA